MKYKVLFLDLDGTTIPNRPDGMPSARVAEAIHKAKTRILVCVASSRPLCIAKHILDQLDIRGLCVLNDATQIYDPVRKKILQTIFIDADKISRIVAVVEKLRLKPMVNNGRAEWQYKTSLKLDRVCSMYVGSVKPPLAERLVEELTKIPNIAVHKMPSWTAGELSVSVSHASATKLHGVMTVAEKLNVDPKEMIGVGDGYNDFPLLMACGLKIAMGNAVPELKAVADFIAPTVEEDGVATVIEKFILNY